MHMVKSILFYVPFGIDIIAILIALYFLITDSINFSSADNTGLTLITVLFCGWVGLCWYLRSRGAYAWGTVLAWIPALPLLLYGLMILAFIVIKPDMK